MKAARAMGRASNRGVGNRPLARPLFLEGMSLKLKLGQVSHG
jgi:hypothetical protein